MSLLNTMDQLAEAEKRISQPEQMLGIGSLQPFNNCNSGSRKLMFSVHRAQTLPVITPEVPFISTGYENEYGRYSSSFHVQESPSVVIGRVQKYSALPNYHYFMITKSEDEKQLDLLEVAPYKHVAETYGYLYDNTVIESLSDGDYIEPGTVIQKAASFDEFNNRMDGVNLNVAYLATERTMEDGFIVSESAAKKLGSPLIRKVKIIVNDNDILLNLYGDDDHYKPLPDIGENVHNGLLCALRREKKEECLYSQSWDKLKEVMVSDDKYQLVGKVVDINVYSNNSEKLSDSVYNGQINMYQSEFIRECHEVVDMVKPYIDKGATMSYSLQKLYYNAVDILKGKQYMDDKAFSNAIIEITVIENNALHVGDKLSNRYGGKGVIAEIVPDELMPISDSGQIVDIVYNMATCVNRLNAGQLFETSITFIGRRIVECIQSGCFGVDECIDMYVKYAKLAAPSFGEYIDKKLDEWSDEDKVNYIAGISNENGIYLSIEPMSESMDIDRLQKLYDEFPVALDNIIVPIKGSDGRIRYSKARRPIIVSKEYIYRLKQYAEEKFSVTSLSSTNIRNENSRNKMNNNYKALYPKTPIRFGEMETGNLIHLGAELVVENLMLYSTSPLGRRLSEQLLTGDPFDVDVKLDMKSTNRSAEILNTYLKTIGLRIVFIKRPKHPIIPFIIHPISFKDQDKFIPIQPLVLYNKNEKATRMFAYEKALMEENKNPFSPIVFHPLKFWDPFAGTDKQFVSKEAIEFMKEYEMKKIRDMGKTSAPSNREVIEEDDDE